MNRRFFMWWVRLLNWIGYRKDTIACMKQSQTWQWPLHLGEQTAGVCAECDEPIYFEKQNRVFHKICNECAFRGPQ